MHTSMLLGLFDWVGDFFKSMFDLVPKVMYLLYASLACLIDVLQLFFRKLAGLDVYYIDGKAVTGDIVTNFIAGILGIEINATDGVQFNYSALSTVFWSFVILGIIICVVSVFIAIIKSHYSYDEKSAKGPMQHVYAGLKAVVNIFAVPIIVVLGLYLSQAVLQAVDDITSVTSGTVVDMYGADKVNEYLVSVDTAKSATIDSIDEKTYIFYDIFGFGGSILYDTGDTFSSVMQNAFASDYKNVVFIGSRNATFSGSLFKVAAYNGNRARLNQLSATDENWNDRAAWGTASFFGGKNSISTSAWGGVGMKLFENANTQDELADMIDTAFACNLHLKSPWLLEYGWAGDIVSFKYFTNFLTRITWNFSKFNIGLVWYYYDLWQFNIIVGFGAIIVCVSIFINIILGMITRLFMCISLFLIAPPLFGLAPLDGGKAAKNWRENFMKQVLMTYGAVLGMNLVFLILPYINQIDFFNIRVADYLAQTLVIIVGLITIKALIATISGIIGAADANETGNKIKEETVSTLGRATSMTIGAAKLGLAAQRRFGGANVMNFAANALNASGHNKLGMAARIAGGPGGLLASAYNKVGGKLSKAMEGKFGEGAKGFLKKAGEFGKDFVSDPTGMMAKLGNEAGRAVHLAGMKSNFKRRKDALARAEEDERQLGKIENDPSASDIRGALDAFRGGNDKEATAAMMKQGYTKRQIEQFKKIATETKGDENGVGAVGKKKVQGMFADWLKNDIEHQNNIAQQRMASAKAHGLERARLAKNVDALNGEIGEARKKFDAGKGGALSFMLDATKEEKAFDTYLDKSGIKKKRDYAKESAENTATIADLLAKAQEGRSSGGSGSGKNNGSDRELLEKMEKMGRDLRDMGMKVDKMSRESPKPPKREE